ncbi:MAG: LptF/LptG family permease [Verrucomicrobia bacterium]|nr:LptF/LptG family permease [Verrucomicrobiota bacterium]
MLIWKKYFYKEIISTALFLLFSFYFLYIVLDLMTHIKDLRAGTTTFSTWALYYLCTFSRRLDILLPFTVLIASIRILLKLKTRNELVALLASGIPLQTLLRPLLLFSCAATMILYANFEFILPKALPQALFIQESHFGNRSIIEQSTPLREIILKDSSKMIYRTYNPQLKQFQDVFWIASVDTIYHMKSLVCEPYPTGKMVDLITRDKQGFLQKKTSYDELLLSNMHFDEQSLKNSITPPRDQSLTQLFSQMMLYTHSQSDRAMEIKGNFYFKLTFPLICLLAFVAVAPYCLHFSRTFSPFMTYLLSIGSLFCFFLFLQVLFVLAKGQTAYIVPSWAIVTLPWLLAFCFFGKKYARSST